MPRRPPSATGGRIPEYGAPAPPLGAHLGRL